MDFPMHSIFLLGAEPIPQLPAQDSGGGKKADAIQFSNLSVASET